MAKVGIAAD